jgi:Tfp pilus assembly protein PilV
MSSIRRQDGFTTIELLISLFIMSAGVISLVGTLDMSRRLTTLSEMKEAASHVGQQKLEEIRALTYSKVALDGIPATSTTPSNPGYYVATNGSGVKTYRWNQKADAPTPHTETLVICTATGTGCPAIGKVDAAAETWSDGRLSGKIYRYVTAVDDALCTATTCPGTSDYKRITVAVTVDQAGGPKSPILLSALMADPDAGPVGEVVDGDENPLTGPSTKCTSGGVVVECANTIDGTVSSFYLYDTPATYSARQDVSASHPSHPTVAPSGTCTSSNTSGCPKPDLMGSTPPPDPTVTPSLYNYSNEVTGGTWPGGAVIRRDAACTGTTTTTDNTKGHLWVTAPLAAPMKLTGDAALNLSTATFNGVSAAVTICVRFYSVGNSIANMVAAPPTAIGTDSYTSSTWPTAATQVSFAMDFRGTNPDYTIPTGSRLGVRIWAASSSGADIAAIYDHPLHPSFIQVNEAN